ncbi:MAG: penicillin acylase family protein, partial [Flavobacteriales bacterium]|nr:penicillin acylase family protein [Flavobacteriales bacterium]
YSTKREDGTLAPQAGDCYILLAKIGRKGIKMESINAFGASNNPNSKHYTDQMQLFSNQKTKPMTLDKETIWNNAERIYHPGQ